MAIDKPKILVKFDRVYGNILCYPANPAAEIITNLTRKKTLSPADLDMAKMLGFEIALAPGSAEVLNAFLAGEVPA